MAYHQHTNAFNGGEQSPLASERFDTPTYAKGCRIMENFLPRVYGGAFRRPGMKYAGDCHDAENESRIIGFNYSVATRYVIELGGGIMRVWYTDAGGSASLVPGGYVAWTDTDHAEDDYVINVSHYYRCILTHTSAGTDAAVTEPGVGSGWQTYWERNAPLEVTTPWNYIQLKDLQFVQLNDVVYVTHPSVAVHKITRVTHNWWTCEPVEWSYPSLAPVNTSATTLKCSKLTGTGATLTASAAVFDSLHEGAHFELVHRRPVSHAVKVGTSSGVTSSLRLLGGWRFTTFGNWDGVFSIEIKNAAGEWETYRSYAGGVDGVLVRNVADSGDFDNDTEARLRFVMDATKDGRGILEADDSEMRGLVKVTAWSSATSVTVDVIKDLASPKAWVSGTVYAVGDFVLWTNGLPYKCVSGHTASGSNDPGDGGGQWSQEGMPTLNWSEEAWSDYRGYPRSISFHQQRLIFGGTNLEPLTVWGSYIGDFENFQRLTYDDAAFSREIAATESNFIQWMVSQKNAILVGTAGEEWLISPGENTALTALNFTVQRQSKTGSAFIQAQLVGDSTIFVQRGKRKLNAFLYSFETEGYTPNDLTLMAEHVTRGQVKAFAFQAQPDPIVWVVTEGGKLLSMTFDRSQKVSAWCRHPTDGLVESVTTVYGPTGQSDQVFFVVARDRDGSTVRTLEYFDTLFWTRLEQTDEEAEALSDALLPNNINYNLARQHFSDCSVTLTNPTAQTTWDGLDHLEGRTVTVLADGAPHVDCVVEGGEIELDYPAYVVVVGLPYTSVLQPNKFELGLPDGSAQGRKFLCKEAYVRYWRSLGGQYAAAPTKERFPILERNVETPMDEAQRVLDGQAKLAVDGAHGESVDLTLFQSQPLPFNVLALVTKFEVHGK